MNQELSKREHRALIKLNEANDHPDFTIKGDLSGIGSATLQSLVEKGLAETGPSRKFDGEIGWRMTAEGQRHLKELGGQA